jgi:hypothetical protein
VPSHRALGGGFNFSWIGVAPALPLVYGPFGREEAMHWVMRSGLVGYEVGKNAASQ